MNAELIINELDKMYENPKCELLYNKDYELLLAVMLSAQTTDKRVNMVTKPVFEKYNTLEKLDNMTLEEVEKNIRTIGMYRTKAKNFKAIVHRIREDYGYVPNDREYLESLPGVGRKTTNVVLSNIYNEPCFAVDTHVNRVSKRLGIANDVDDVLEVEEKLMKYFPKENWGRLHHQLVLFGRYTCKSKGALCDTCPFNGKCKK